jgi:hypothetical protein
MKRKEVLKDYKVDKGGRIRSPGKFEGEMLYVPAFWEAGLEGMADDDDGSVYTFRLSAEDKKEYPELGRKRTLKLAESDQGFVYEL